MTGDYPEENATLWILAAPPAIWAAHFLLSYGTAAIWCAKVAGPDGSLSGARVAIAVYSVVALVGIAVLGRRGFQHHALAGSTSTHDFDTPEARHRFLGFATFLLAWLSAVAIFYAALPLVFVGSCR
jgi:hypothetical protein